MPLHTAFFCILLLLGGCASQPQPPVRHALPAASPPVLHGIILAKRLVPPGSLRPVQVLLSGPDSHAGATAPALFEFIVRTTNGTTIAVVQPESGHLQPGARVNVVPGTPARIDAPVTPADTN